MPTLTNIIQHSLRSPSTAVREEKEIIGIQIGKEVKLSLFADDMILNIENPKDATRKLLELINEFSKITGYKVNTQKSLVFLYTNNERPEREIKETIPFTTATKRIKYLGINLSKEAKHIMRNTGLEEAQAGIKIAGRRKWQLTPVLLPGESHGGTSLVGYSPWGRRVRQD